MRRVSIGPGLTLQLWFVTEAEAGARESIDEVIRSVAQNWDIERMAVIDRNVLRMATFELLSNQMRKASENGATSRAESWVAAGEVVMRGIMAPCSPAQRGTGRGYTSPP